MLPQDPHLRDITRAPWVHGVLAIGVIQFGMIANPASQIDLSKLRNLVQHTLADLGQFEPGVFPLTERVVQRGGENCGFYFCLHGPRSVKLTAVCDLKKLAIFFYGTDGGRVHQVPLSTVARRTPSQSATVQRA